MIQNQQMCVLKHIRRIGPIGIYGDMITCILGNIHAAKKSYSLVNMDT